MSYAVSVVHLSDLHFGKNSRFKDRDSENLGKQLAQTIMKTSQSRFETGAPDIVIATGDLTQQAGQTEFDKARLFFESLQAGLNIPRSRFVFLPGNHDVSWSACKEYFSAKEELRKLKYDPNLEKKKFALFNTFKSDFYGDIPPKTEDLERGAVLHIYEDLRLCVVALNSCEQETDAKHIGVVSREQARPVMDSLLNRDAFKEYMKILSLHHPVNALPDNASLYLKELGKQQEITKDLLDRFQADALSIEGNSFINSIIEDCHAHLVLHGHQHAFDAPHPWKWKEHVDGYCQICPAGCFGLKPDGLLEDQPSCLNLIHLQEKNARLEMKKIFLEYDPMERLRGSLEYGCFRDTGRDPATALFPLPSALQHSTPPSGSVPSVTAGHGEFVEWVRAKIESLLVEAPAFRKVLAGLFNEADVAGPMASALMLKGLVPVWKEIVNRLDRMKEHLTCIRSLLFLLAQAECKAELVEEIRDQLKKGERINIFTLKTRYVEIGELILKAALREEKIQVDKGSSRSRFSALKMIDLRDERNLRDTGIDSGKMRTEAINYLMEKLQDFDTWGSSEEALKVRDRDLEDRLETNLASNEPFYVVHYGNERLNIPYVVEFLAPSPSALTMSDAVTQCGDARIYELIALVLNKTAEFTN